MPGLILEGGTFRPIFSSGVMDALLDHDLMFDYVIGVSAGITDGFSYVSRQRGRNLEVARRFRNDKRYLSPANLLKCRSIFGLDFVFDTIPNELLPFDWDTFRAYQGKILVGVTNAETGQCEYLDGKDLDEKCTMLRATCSLPVYFPPARIGNKIYYDGGISDSIPIRKAISDGNRKNLIVLTQPKGYRKKIKRRDHAAAAALHRKFPAMAEVILNRPKMYNDTVCFCEHLVQYQPQNTVLLQPETPINSFESDVEKLVAAYNEGYRLAEERMDEIRKLFD